MKGIKKQHHSERAPQINSQGPLSDLPHLHVAFGSNMVAEMAELEIYRYPNQRSGLCAGAKKKKKRERKKLSPDTSRDKLPSAHQSLINQIIRDLPFLIQSEFTGSK